MFAFDLKSIGETIKIYMNIIIVVVVCIILGYAIWKVSYNFKELDTVKKENAVLETNAETNKVENTADDKANKAVTDGTAKIDKAVDKAKAKQKGKITVIKSDPKLTPEEKVKAVSLARITSLWDIYCDGTVEMACVN